MVSVCIILIAITAICSIRRGYSEEIDEILATTSVLWSVCAQENGHCTASACKDSNAETGEADEKYNASFGLPLQKPDSTVYCRGGEDICDCSDIKADGYKASGVYRIYVDHQRERHYADAYCDMTTANRSWTVFQRRKDGSENFFRGWTDYKNGFGNAEGEYWLGNEFLHLLTSKRRYRLRIDLEDFEGEERYAQYSIFNVSSAAANYSLTVGQFFSPNLDDSFTYHNDHQFSTRDAENDVNRDGNCAEWGQAGWWYASCIGSNLNGLYLSGNYSETCSHCYWSGITWQAWHGLRYSLKTTEMKVSAF